MRFGSFALIACLSLVTAFRYPRGSINNDDIDTIIESQAVHDVEISDIDSDIGISSENL